MPVFRLLDDDVSFPDPALAEPDGLLAVGGDLSPQRLLTAYSQGIFPWYGEDNPILWWSPDPRCVLFPDDFHCPRSLRRVFRSGRFHCTLDTAFSDVIAGCAGKREGAQGTWIVPEMLEAYSALHHMGIAHSVEAWQDGELAGGLYGVALGSAFFGESMFRRVPDASKVALVYLVDTLRESGFTLIDCQQETAHMLRFGATAIPRDVFMKHVYEALTEPTRLGNWSGGVRIYA